MLKLYTLGTFAVLFRSVVFTGKDFLTLKRTATVKRFTVVVINLLK